VHVCHLTIEVDNYYHQVEYNLDRYHLMLLIHLIDHLDNLLFVILQLKLIKYKTNERENKKLNL
jgi:hypothetical protein